MALDQTGPEALQILGAADAMADPDGTDREETTFQDALMEAIVDRLDLLYPPS